MIAVPPALSGLVDAVPMQWMQYVMTDDAVLMKVDAVSLQCLQCPCIVRECGCSSHAVDPVSHKVDAVFCGGGCSAHEGGCSDPAVVAVHPAVSLNVDAVNMQWMQ